MTMGQPKLSGILQDISIYEFFICFLSAYLASRRVRLEGQYKKDVGKVLILTRWLNEAI
jgi:hypothetical protein